MISNRSKKTHLTVLTGRHGQYEASPREKTTRFPTAGESIQAHIILLRAPTATILERQLARGYDIETVDGHLAVTLRDPITAAHYVEALVAAYSTIDLPRERIISAITTQAFGEDQRPATEAYIEALLEGADPDRARERLGKSPRKIISLKLLSETSKMGCHSFNLPPGPVYQDGTCPASQLGFMFETDQEHRAAQKTQVAPGKIVPPDFICNGCYAIKGAYGNPSIVFAMSMRMLMTKKWLASGEFSTVLAEAISLARARSRRRLKKVSQELAWTIPHPDYFRIHDAGDYFSPAYAEAWFDVCDRLPDVWFWSPTRMWAMRKQASTVFGRGVPTNLALRPSALHFGEAAPFVEDADSPDAHMPDLSEPLYAPGMSAGSGSGSAPKSEDWPCPAYEHPDLFGGGRIGPHGRVVEGTCSRAHGPDSPARGGNDPGERPMSQGGAGCRACWRARTRPIFYHEH